MGTRQPLGYFRWQFVEVLYIKNSVGTYLLENLPTKLNIQK